MTADVRVEFSSATHSLAALQAASYRLIGTATCQIDESPTGWVCHLNFNSSRREKISDLEVLKSQFLDLVTDEILRERVAAKTEGVRNVILALAFGALANKQNS